VNYIKHLNKLSKPYWIVYISQSNTYRQTSIPCLQNSSWLFGVRI